MELNYQQTKKFDVDAEVILDCKILLSKKIVRLTTRYIEYHEALLIKNKIIDVFENKKKYLEFENQTINVFGGTLIYINIFESDEEERFSIEYDNEDEMEDE